MVKYKVKGSAKLYEWHAIAKLYPHVSWPKCPPSDTDFLSQLNITVVPIGQETPSLDELKGLYQQAISDSFTAHVAGSFMCFLGWPMQFAESDSIKMEGAIKLLESQNAEAGYLTDANDVTHYDVPIADMRAVLLEMLSAYAAAHARKQLLRAQVETARSAKDLNAIEITWNLKGA